MFTLGCDSGAGQREEQVIIGRGELRSTQPGGYPPLVVNPRTLGVTAVVPAADLELRFSQPWARSDIHQDGVYMYWAEYATKPGIYRLALPDFKPELVLDNAPDGFVVFTGDQLHVVGRAWWTRRFREKELRRLPGALPWWFASGWAVPGRPPEPPQTPELPRMEAIFHSNHYGLLVSRAASTARETALFEVSGLLEAAAQAPSDAQGAAAP